MQKEALGLIDEAFYDLEMLKERFLDCERAYRAVYKDEPNRTAKIKSTQRSRSRVYVPLIKTTISIIHSIFKTSFMSDRCPIEITRVGLKTQNDLILQNALTAMLKNRWKQKEHRIGLSKAVLSALYLPLGIVSLFYDKNQNQIRTKFIPITDLAFDKNAGDINDIEYVAYKWNQSVREVKQKIKNGYYKKSDVVLPHNAKDSDRVMMRDLYEKYYENGKSGFKLKSFANDVLVREAKFSRLPFHFGYCIEAMPSVEESLRSEENGVYGSCIPEIAKELQEEYNIKRNQKIDIIERQIDPSIAIDADAGDISISDIASNKKFIRVKTINGKSVNDLMHTINVPSAYSLSEEISMLKNEYEIITGVNSVMTGQTSPSDRRAMGALQTVNAASSMRIESMLQTLMETMLISYAEHFVELIYKHGSDEDFIKITEDENIINIIGTQDFRAINRLDFDINVNFGTTIANDVKISQLNGLLGMLAQNGLNSPTILSTILKEVLTLILGENAPIQMIDEAIAMQINAAQAQMQEQTQNQSEDEQTQAILNGGI